MDLAGVMFMHEFTKILIFDIIFCILITSAGYVSADNETSTATTKIITPIQIHKKQDLNFGKMAAGNSAGTVTIDPTKWGNDRVSVNGVVIVSSAKINDAWFEVSGEKGVLYVVTLPSTITVTSSSNSMLVDNFICTPWSNSGWAPEPTPGISGTVGTLRSSNGKDDIFIGATLHVNAMQPQGTYTGSFSVTVAYQ